MLQGWGGVMWGLPGCGTGETSRCPGSGATSARAGPLSASCCALALWTGRQRSSSMASAWGFTGEGEHMQTVPLCHSQSQSYPVGTRQTPSEALDGPC